MFQFLSLCYYFFVYKGRETSCHRRRGGVGDSRPRREEVGNLPAEGDQGANAQLEGLTEGVGV